MRRADDRLPCLSTILFGERLTTRVKNENRENPAAMCGSGSGERRVDRRNWRATPGRTIKGHGSAGLLWRKETECRFQEGDGEIRRAHGSVAGNDAHEQGRVGTAYCGC